MTLRVLQVVPTLGLGGGEQVVTDLAAGLSDLGVDVEVACLFDSINSHHEARLEEKGIRINYLGKRPGFDPVVCTRLRCLLRDRAVSILHSHLRAFPYTTATPCRRPLLRIHTVQNIADREAGVFGRRVHAFAFRRGATPIAVAEEVAASMERTYSIANCITIPNGIDLENFDPDPVVIKEWRAQLGCSEDDFAFLSIGRLASQKNPLLMLEAFCAGPSSDSRNHLIFAGDGPLRRVLSDEIRKRGLESQVHVLGFQKEVRTLLSAADVVTSSSDYEGKPLALMEAMAAGKPVIATAVGGIPEVVHHGTTGILVAPHDPPALAEAMCRLSGDPNLGALFGSRGRQVASDKFSATTMCKRYLSLYEELLDVSRR